MRASTTLLVIVAVCAAGCDSKKEQAPEEPAEKTSGVEAPTTAAQESAPDVGGAEEKAESPRPTGPNVTAFDFMNNRHLAHVWSGGLVIDVGTPSAVKYVDGDDWYEGFSAEDALVSNPKGDSAEFLIPLGGPGHQEKSEGYKIAVRLRPLGKQRATFSIRGVGGQKVKFATLDDLGAGWGTHTVALPDGLPLGKEYRVTIDFSDARAIPNGGRSAAEVDWVSVGPDPSKVIRRGEVIDTLGNRVRLPDGGAVWWTTILPEHGEFVAGADGLVDLVLQVDGEKPVTIEQTGGKFKVDVGKYAGKPIAIGFVARKSSMVTRPRIEVPGAEKRDRKGAPEYVMLWVANGLRADHISTYAPESDVETPNIDEFAKKSAVFYNAVAQAGGTAASSSSIFTMSYPAKYDLVSASKVPFEATLLPEPFQSTGWATGLFSSSEAVGKSAGFDRGFDEVSVPPKRKKADDPGPDTEHLWPKVEEWLGGQKAPVFVYVNTVDTMLPFDPAPTLVEKYAPGAPPAGLEPGKTGELAEKSDLDDATKRHLGALYKAEVTHHDLWFGSALETLDAKGIRDETMIVFTSAHGMELGEHGRVGSTDSVNREAVWVPLMIQYTPWTEKGIAVDETVELLDLYRTLLDAGKVGRINAVNFQGRSMLEDIVDPTPRMPRPAFSYSKERVGVQIGDWKYQRSDEDDHLYHFAADAKPPYEAMNVSGRYPIAHRVMRDAVGFQLRYDDEWDKNDRGHVNNHTDRAARKLDKEAW